MALYVVYRKAEETETDVTYRFGSGPEELDQTLRITKVDSRVVPADGTPTALATRVASKVLGRRRADGVWPGGGGIQS
ncbi:hypothetical protein [Streptomyces sp. NPDC048172]|uniref:hypothetical protein n=1 Tax=Streptomyces sp. NPDC048172 TaxID=3365505 RepID=UPI0037200CA6